MSVHMRQWWIANGQSRLQYNNNNKKLCTFCISNKCCPRLRAKIVVVVNNEQVLVACSTLIEIIYNGDTVAPNISNNDQPMNRCGISVHIFVVVLRRRFFLFCRSDKRNIYVYLFLRSIVFQRTTIIIINDEKSKHFFLYNKMAIQNSHTLASVLEQKQNKT